MFSGLSVSIARGVLKLRVEVMASTYGQPTRGGSVARGPWRYIVTKGPERYAATKDYGNCIRGTFITVFLVPYSQGS
jgi:hypothetical protein